MRARTRSLIVAAFIVSMGCGIGPCGPSTAPTSGDLYYTVYSGTPNVKKVHYDFDGTIFKVGKPVAIASVPAADGITFAPDGTLLIGGQGSAVYDVHPSTGKFTTAKTEGAFHMAIDPSGNYAYSGGIPGPLYRYNLNPFGSPHQIKLTGDDTEITSLVWDSSGNAYYTSSGPGGGGDIGKIDLGSGRTKRYLQGIAASHGMVFDAYTGYLVAFGGNHVAQIDPSNMRVVSDKTIGGGVGQLDQGTADGKGHVFIAENGGRLVFIDYSQSKHVSDRGAFVAVISLEPAMDDVAPLSGSGAKPAGGPFGLCAPSG